MKNKLWVLFLCLALLITSTGISGTFLYAAQMQEQEQIPTEAAIAEKDDAGEENTEDPSPGDEDLGEEDSEAEAPDKYDPAENEENEDPTHSDTEEETPPSDSDPEPSENPPVLTQPPDTSLPEKNYGDTGEIAPPEPEIPAEHEGTGETDANLSEILILNPDNIDQVEGDSKETEELLEEIEEGEIIALSPLPAEAADPSAPAPLSAENGVTRAASGKYTLVDLGFLYCDEVWTKANLDNGTRNVTRNYRLEYVDADGNLVQTPAYCIEANDSSLMDTTTKDDLELKDEAIKALTNSTMKKLLYFGWGGPGNACGNYDPTCSHITWNARNQYIFTHIALSKIYSGQVGNATAEELEHVGVNRFLTYISGLSLPSHNATSLQVTDVEGAKESGQSIQADLKVLRNAGDRFPYLWDAYKDECRMTNTITVSDTNAKNGIEVTRKSSDNWQLLYWTSTADYQERGTADPRIGPTSGTVELKNTARFVLVFPAGQNTKKTFRFPAILRPVSYLWLDADIQSSDRFQDYGFVTYEGTYGYAELTVEPLPMGSLLLSKTCRQTGQKIAGAQYTLYAGENLSSGKSTYFKKDAVVDTRTTNGQGQCRFSSLIPGKYYVKETKAPDGYDLDSTRYDVTVKANNTTSAAEAVVAVQDDRSRPELCSVTVTKKIRAEDITWAHGNPTFFFCVEGNDIYGQKRKYEDFVCFTRENLKVDGDGYAALSVTFDQVPEGSYQIYEQETLRYYLKDAAAGTKNVTIRKGQSPQYGIPPRSIAYGEAVLNKTASTAAITFVNEKLRYDGYSHTSVLKNKIPLIARTS